MYKNAVVFRSKAHDRTRNIQYARSSLPFEIGLKCGLPGALSSGQVSKKSCLPRTNEWVFVEHYMIISNSIKAKFY